MGYKDALLRGGQYKESELKDVCVSISTIHTNYALAFIEFETDTLLGINVTRPDLTEGFVILNKEYIISISVVYEGDIIISSKKEEDFSYI